MQKKLTITIDERVYAGLYAVIGQRRISQFIENLVRPHVMNLTLEAAYYNMAADEKREQAAEEWTEGLMGDIDHAER